MANSSTAYLLLGSNSGNRLGNLNTALDIIKQKTGSIEMESYVYETEAWGIKEQHSFLNKAVAIKTLLAPEQLLLELKMIEQEVGRTKSIKWGPREIDIDILLYDDKIVDTSTLKIPHPFLHLRKFTLLPLAEIAGNVVHPVLMKNINDLLQLCEDNSEVILYTP